MNKKITNGIGSIGNIVEAKAEAEESDQLPVFSVQSVSQSFLSAKTGQQSFNPSVLQFLQSPQVFRMTNRNTKVIFCSKLKAFQAIILIFRFIEVTFAIIIK